MKSIPVRLLKLGSVIALLAACAQVLEKPEPPRVSLVNLELESMTLFEQRFHLELRLQNPNPYPLPLAGMEYTVELNGEKFAEGVSNDKVTVPEYGEALVGVDVTSNLASLIEQLYRLQRGASPSLAYRLHGSVGVVDRAFKLPFEQSGEIRLQPPSKDRRI